MICYKGVNHKKRKKDCVHIDSTTAATVLHRYLTYEKSIIFDYWTGKPIKMSKSLRIQWQNIKSDLTLPIWNVRYVIGVITFFLFLKGVVKVPLFLGTVDFDNNGSSDSGTSTNTTFTLSHTTGGTATLMIVGCATLSGATPASTTGDYNGSSFTLFHSGAEGSSPGLAMLSRVSPATGTHTVTVNTNASTTIRIISATFVGASGTIGTVQDSGDLAPMTSNTDTRTVTSATGDMVMDFTVAATNTARTFSYGAGQTEIVSITLTHWLASADFEGAGASRHAGSSSVDMTVTMSGTCSGRHVAFNIQASAGGGGGATLHSMGLLGVGT